MNRTCFDLSKPLILVSNDDGYNADGLRAIVQAIRGWSNVIVCAPSGPRSGFACAITTGTPVHLDFIEQDTDYEVWSCSGTPVDCVKIALEKVCPRRPDLLISGINHGDNASISLLYSGTMGAAFEGCMKGIPSIGLSLYLKRGMTYAEHPVDEATLQATSMLCRKVIEQGLPPHVCLDVNYPLDVPFKGWRLCRQCWGSWSAEWNDAEENTDSTHRSYFLTGIFTNLEPTATDTDMHALSQGFCSIVPVTADLTAYDTLNSLLGTAHGTLELLNP